MPEQAVTDYAREKIKEIAIHLCTVLSDLMLACIWLVGEYVFEHYIVPRFQVESPIVTTSLWMFRILFAISTLIPCGSKLLKHVRILVLRDTAAVSQVRTELRTKSAAAAVEERP